MRPPHRLASTPAVEATAPCILDLGGGVLAGFDAALWPADPVSVGVALDRRAQCRVETTPSGLRVESKDTLEKLEVDTVADLPMVGVLGLVRRALAAVGAESGLKLVTQARVPSSAGLSSDTALAIAVAAAAARALGRVVAPHEWPGLAHGPGRIEPGAVFGAQVSVWGGAAAVPLSAPGPRAAERLRVDPARIEECLLLVDPGAPSEPPASRGEGEARAALAEVAAGALRVRDALVAGAFSQVAGLLAAEHQAWRRLGLVAEGGPVEAIVRVALAAGGAARACGTNPRSLVLVWAEPGERRDGPREAVTVALKAAGHRTFPCRLDLRGLEVEEA